MRRKTFFFTTATYCCFKWENTPNILLIKPNKVINQLINLQKTNKLKKMMTAASLYCKLAAAKVRVPWLVSTECICLFILRSLLFCAALWVKLPRLSWTRCFLCRLLPNLCISKRHTVRLHMSRQHLFITSVEFEQILDAGAQCSSVWCRWWCDWRSGWVGGVGGAVGGGVRGRGLGGGSPGRVQWWRENGLTSGRFFKKIACDSREGRVKENWMGAWSDLPKTAVQHPAKIPEASDGFIWIWIYFLYVSKKKNLKIWFFLSQWGQIRRIQAQVGTTTR